MDRPSAFLILSRQEFDGLSFEEKLAYLDLQLTSQLGEASQEQVGGFEREGKQPLREPTSS